MTAFADERLTLRVRGMDHAGWKSISVQRSLESVAGGFKLELAEAYPQNENPLGIRAGDPCEIYLGDDLVLTGYAMSPSITHTGEDISASVGGHSKTGELVQCSCITSPAQFRKQTLTQIATALAAPYGVSVVDEVGLTETVRRFAPETGEPVFSAIERVAQDQHVLVTDSPAGDLVLTRVLSDSPTVAIQPWDPSSMTLSADASDRFSEYRVIGSCSGNDQVFGADSSGLTGSIADPEIDRTRVLVIKGKRQMTAASAKARATAEATIRAGKSATLTLSFPSWRDPNGDVWEPGRICSVFLPSIGVDATLVVVDVDLNGSEGGRVADLLLRPTGAYEPIPPLERTRRKKKKITAGVGLWEEIARGVIGFVPGQE